MLWKSGRRGNLCPLEQVRAIALRDAYTDLPGALPKSGGQAALLSAIAERVTKIGGGHPSKEAIRLLLERYDADPSGWYPGKSDQAKFGPSPVLNGAKRRCIATAASVPRRASLPWNRFQGWSQGRNRPWNQVDPGRIRWIQGWIRRWIQRPDPPPGSTANHHLFPDPERSFPDSYIILIEVGEPGSDPTPVGPPRVILC